MGGSRPGVRLAGGAGTEVREDLVDHRGLGDERNDAPRAVAGRARERIHLEDLQGAAPPTGGWPRRARLVARVVARGRWRAAPWRWRARPAAAGPGAG